MIHDEKDAYDLSWSRAHSDSLRTFAGAFGGEVDNSVDAIEDAMMKGNTNPFSH